MPPGGAYKILGVWSTEFETTIKKDSAGSKYK